MAFKRSDIDFGVEGEKAVARYLGDIGYRVTRYPDGPYGVDMIAVGAVFTFRIEVERRFSDWKSGPFPYSTVRIPGRRVRADRGRLNSILLVLCKDMTRFLMVHPMAIRAAINAGRVSVKDTAKVQSETIVNVPINDTLEIDMADRRVRAIFTVGDENEISFDRVDDAPVVSDS